MRMMVPKFDWFNLDQEILSIGTCRAIRLQRIGRTFLVQSGHFERDANDHVETVWKTVAISKGEDDKKSYVDAMEFLSSANIKVLEFIAKEHEKDKKP